jgi:hypothetical protein
MPVRDTVSALIRKEQRRSKVMKDTERLIWVSIICVKLQQTLNRLIRKQTEYS